MQIKRTSYLIITFVSLLFCSTYTNAGFFSAIAKAFTKNVDSASQSSSKHADDLFTNTTKQSDNVAESTATKTEDDGIVNKLGEEAIKKPIEQCIQNCTNPNDEDKN